jgi:phosphoglucosamine mutase
VAQVLPDEGPVVIGMDSRSSGPMLVAALTAGLTAAGRQVWQSGPLPHASGAWRDSPRVGAAGGLMVSASHDPPRQRHQGVWRPVAPSSATAQQQAIEAGPAG